MIKTSGYAALDSKTPIQAFQFERRDPGVEDVLIDILYCGICHSDIHQARNEWGGSMYPMVPGHEIIGRISAVGSNVSKFKKGELVGVGCFVDSCRKCGSCKEGEEQFCDEGASYTYNAFERDKKTLTQGGYSKHIVVDQNYVLKVSEKLNAAAAAPLLCAGITTYSPLKYHKIKRGDRVAVVGLGGLGHMAVKLAAAMGAEVSVLSTSLSKKDDALKLGAKNFYSTKEAGVFAKLANTFDLIINTVSAPHNYNEYLGTLKRDKTMVIVGIPEKELPLSAGVLIHKRRRIQGSLIGGIKETQEMLNFCAEHGIVSDVEIIPPAKINEAYERTIKADVKYRFVIDLNA